MENNKIIKYEAGIVQHVSKMIAVAGKLLSVNLRPLKILHLEDHSLFAKGVSNCVLKNFPNTTIKHIRDGTSALAYVLNSLYKKECIDLIITDVSHPGLDGLEFSHLVREKEEGSLRKIPIFFIDVYADKPFVQRIEAIPFTKYLITSKASCEEICLAINNFI